jgi:hypothetical protein
MLELVGVERTVSVHELGGGAVVAEYAADYWADACGRKADIGGDAASSGPGPDRGTLTPPPDLSAMPRRGGSMPEPPRQQSVVLRPAQSPQSLDPESA